MIYTLKENKSQKMCFERTSDRCRSRDVSVGNATIRSKISR